jgi:hypothetical protein
MKYQDKFIKEPRRKLDAVEKAYTCIDLNSTAKLFFSYHQVPLLVAKG